MIRNFIFALLVLLVGVASANAAGVEICYQPTSGLNCTPVSAANPLPTTATGGSQYPSGATPIVASATGTTSATAATLAATGSQYTFICGFSIRANANAAATGNATVSDGTFTLNFTQWTAVNTSGLGVAEEIFVPCIPGSAVNTGVAVTSAAPGTGGVVSVSAWGYTKATSP